MLNLTMQGVEVFIKRFQNKNQESFWENYDLIIWKNDPSGYSNANGMFRNAWGISEKIIVSESGIWKLPKKYVKYFK